MALAKTSLGGRKHWSVLRASVWAHRPPVVRQELWKCPMGVCASLCIHLWVADLPSVCVSVCVPVPRGFTQPVFGLGARGPATSPQASAAPEWWHVIKIMCPQVNRIQLSWRWSASTVPSACRRNIRRNAGRKCAHSARLYIQYGPNISGHWDSFHHVGSVQHHSGWMCFNLMVFTSKSGERCRYSLLLTLTKIHLPPGECSWSGQLFWRCSSSFVIQK